MSDISLEKIDAIRERTGVTYTEAKEALEFCNGDVIEALVYIENNQKNQNTFSKEDVYTTKEEFMTWMKDIIKKGNVNRIIVKKDDKVVVDVPVNAGVAVGVIAVMVPVIGVIGALTAVFTKLTIEIVKNDGSVEVVNKVIKSKAQDVKEKFDDFASEMKEKFDNKTQKNSDEGEDGSVYQYTVTFEEFDEDKQNETEVEVTEVEVNEEKEDNK